MHTAWLAGSDSSSDSCDANPRVEAGKGVKIWRIYMSIMIISPCVAFVKNNMAVCGSECRNVEKLSLNVIAGIPVMRWVCWIKNKCCINVDIITAVFHHYRMVWQTFPASCLIYVAAVEMRPLWWIKTALSVRFKHPKGTIGCRELIYIPQL